MRTVGRYVLHKPIASGGMGTVFLGRMLGSAGFARTVAIKAMNSSSAHDEEFVSMFLDEGRLAARVQHPNVVSTLDVVHEGTDLLLVMEYVHGESLARLTRPRGRDAERVPAAVAAAILCDVLDGLHAAHEATDARGAPLEIVHRDVSPQNVIVGVDGVARVADFGVAKAMGRLHTTREGDVKGKLAYMAPEQFRGGTVDRRTDVFAASVVLWEALTGQRLFSAATEGEVVGRVLANEITAPSRHVPALPSALEAVVMRGLEGDPDKRHPTAHAMARAIENAGPVARRGEVGEWVTSLAKESLEGRARLIADVERVTAERDSAAARVVAAVASSEQLPVETGTDASDSALEPIPMERTSIPVSAHSRPRGAAPKNFAAIALGVLLVSILGTAAFIYVRGPVARVDARAPSSVAPGQPAESSPANTAPPIASAPSAPSAPSASPAPTVSASASTAPRVSVPIRSTHPAASARPKTTPKPDCSDPCPFDDRGVKVCKVECLH